MSSTNGNTQNIYDANHLNTLFDVNNAIQDITVKDNQDNSYKFADICEKIYANNDNCYVSCILEFFNFNQTLMTQYITNTETYANDNSIDLNRVITYPVAYSPYSQQYQTLLTRAGDPISRFRYVCHAFKFINTNITTWNLTLPS